MPSLEMCQGDIQRQQKTLGKKPSFKRGTTPSIPFYIVGYDLTNYALYLTFSSKDMQPIIKRESDMDVSYDSDTDTSTIVCAFSQEETLAMPLGTIEVELKFTDDGGATVGATENVTIVSKKALLEEVIDGE